MTKNRGRKPSTNWNELGYTTKTVNRDTVLHNPEILNITVYSNDVEKLDELAISQFLSAKGIAEDTAGTVLNHVWKKSELLNNKPHCFDSMVKIAEALGLSYPTVQKVVKKLVELNVVELGLNKKAIIPSNETIAFLDTLKQNKQIVITYKPASDEQMAEFLANKPVISKPKVKKEAVVAPGAEDAINLEEISNL